MKDFIQNQHALEADRAIRDGRGPDEAEVQRRRQEVDHLISQMALDCAYAADQFRRGANRDSVQRAFDAVDRVIAIRARFRRESDAVVQGQG